MVDLHSHILPGIDDGSTSLEESLDLCRIAAGDGIRTIVCTPHADFRFPNRRETIEGPFGALERLVREAGLDLRLVKGAEVHMAPDILERIREKDLVTYADKGRHLLLEFPFQQVITGTEELVYRLKLAGVTPVIAHPERIAYFMEEPDRLYSLVRLGALGQVTGGSLNGSFGERSRRACITMMERHLVHVVASDAHDTSYRRPELAGAAEEAARRFGPDRARAMFVDYPSAVVEGRDVEPPPPQESSRRGRRFLSRLLSRDPR